MSYQDFGAVIDQAQAETVHSQGLDFARLSGASIHAVWGAVTGTLTLEANDDPVGFSDDWVPVSVVAFEALAGSPGKQMVEISNMRSSHYRLAYVHTGGTGSLRVVVRGKSR